MVRIILQSHKKRMPRNFPPSVGGVAGRVPSGEGLGEKLLAVSYPLAG